SSSWNLTVNSVKNGLISTTIPNSWETLGPHQSSVVNVGLIVSSSSQNFTPTQITVNGSPATITVK
ncbi:MAG TPA: hypothetical protein VLE95_06330, partial [Chlamydiales bacterium]|nr:hypothetical protein [Chlamydiales bacterium]